MPDFSTVGQPKIFGKVVDANELYDSVEIDRSKLDFGKAKLIRVRVVEYQGEYYRVGGICILFVGIQEEGTPTPENLLKKDQWPHEAVHYWHLKDDTKVIRLNAYHGSIFDVLYEPEVQADVRAGSGDIVGRGSGDVVGRGSGDLTARHGSGDLVAMGRVHKGGRLIG